MLTQLRKYLETERSDGVGRNDHKKFNSKNTDQSGESHKNARLCSKIKCSFLLRKSGLILELWISQ